VGGCRQQAPVAKYGAASGQVVGRNSIGGLIAHLEAFGKAFGAHQFALIIGLSERI